MIKIKKLNYMYKSYKKEKGIKGAFKDFRHRQVEEIYSIRDFDLNVEKGEVIGLLGPNGAGKTTLIKLLVGILEPMSGEISCDGYKPFDKNKKYLKNIGVVLGQKSQLIWDLPAVETLDMLRLIYKIDREKYEQKLAKMTKLLNLEEKLNTPVRKLSMGERVKFEIICSLIHSPKLLFLDEPTIGLDLTSQLNIHEFLNEINRTEKTTMIITSHYLKDIEALCDRVVILLKGKKRADTTIRKLIDGFSDDGDNMVIQLKEDANLKSDMGKIVDGKIIIDAKELSKFIENTDVEEIESIERNKKSFEEVIFSIYEEE